MTPENFTYWLHGFFEIGRADSLTPGQVQEIRNHLNLVLRPLGKITNDLTSFNKSLETATYCSNSKLPIVTGMCGIGPYGSLGTIDKVDLSKIDTFKPNPYYYNPQYGLTGVNMNIVGSC